MRRCVSFFYGSRWRLAVAVALGIAQMLVLLPIPFLLLHAFDRGIPGRDYRSLVFVGVAMIGLQMLSAAFAMRARAIALRTVKSVVYDIRAALVQRWYELPRSRYASIEPAAEHDLWVHATERVDVMAIVVLIHVLPTTVLAAGIGVILVWLSPMLSGVVVALLPVALLISHRLRRRLRDATRTFHRSFERFSRGTWLALEATDLTKMQAAESRERARQERAMRELREDSLRLTWLQTSSTTGHSTLTVLFGGVILVAGGVLLARDVLTLGELMSFYGALALLRSSASLALGAVPHVIEGREAIARLDAALQEEPVPIYTGTRIADVTGDVVFEHVAFGYDARTLVLRDVTFHLRPGQVVGITGESGTGKTTLSMLLLGLYRPVGGRILFDGVSIDELDVTDLRRQIGTMAQDPLILSESVAANIAFGLRASGRDEAVGEDVMAARVRDAAMLAGAHEFIEDLAEGYETVLGTRGINLSGGQRQRIALARALIKAPRLLVLDEPTNHLGTSTVTRVLARVAAWPVPPAILVISHDPELLMHLPSVLQLSDGALAPRRATLLPEPS